jgi:NADH pyrophosphatase NudC (nudix superfamily)
MTLVVFIGALLLLGIAVIAVAWPLMEERRGRFSVVQAGETLAEVDPLAELIEQRDAIYQAIRELRFDHQVGKVSEADFTAFDAQLRGRAALVLQQIDALGQAEADPELDASLEAEIAALRQVNSGAPAGSARLAPVAVPAGKAALNFCPQCGHRLQAGDRFCGKCGAALS